MIAESLECEIKWHRKFVRQRPKGGPYQTSFSRLPRSIIIFLTDQIIAGSRDHSHRTEHAIIDKIGPNAADHQIKLPVLEKHSFHRMEGGRVFLRCDRTRRCGRGTSCAYLLSSYDKFRRWLRISVSENEALVATPEELELKVKLLEELAAKDSSQEIRSAATRAQTLLKLFHQAMAASQTAEGDQVGKEIANLADSASQLISQRMPAKSDKWWPYVGMAVLAIVFIGLAWFFYRYIAEAGLGKLSTFEGTRPLLVIAAIISTIAFGGALLIGSLFSSEGTFEERFRHSREIFLVFAGIFGTVIGFYFGAGDSKTSQIGIDAILEDATVVAYANGGTPPYKISIAYGSKDRTKTEETKTGWARFSFDKKTDNILPLKISAIDNKNLQGDFVLRLSQDDLKKAGWSLPEEKSVTQPSKPEVANKPPLPAPIDRQGKPARAADQKSVPDANK